MLKYAYNGLKSKKTIHGLCFIFTSAKLKL
jgi:hypothetical protein